MATLLLDPVVRQIFTASCPRLPLAMLEETYSPAPRWHDGPAGYLQLSEAYGPGAATASELGWPIARVMSHHLALLTDPCLVAGALHELAGPVPSRRAGQAKITGGSQVCGQRLRPLPDGLVCALAMAIVDLGLRSASSVR